MKTILPLFVMICLCCSCSDDINHKRILMNDGTVVTLKNSNIVHYASEQELINDIFDNYRVYAESRSDSDDAIKSERKDSVSGYTEIRYYSDWISATFGEWAKAYDFMPNEKYYIRIAGCVKELPCYSGEQLIPAIYDDDDKSIMAFVANDKRGFTVSQYRNSDGYFEGVSLIVAIEYNGNGDPVGMFYPINDLSSLEWRFRAYIFDWDWENN